MQEIETETAVTGARAIPLGAELVPELIADDILNEAEADDAWAAPGWREAAVEYHKARDGRASIAPYAPEEIARLRRLLDDDVSLDRAWHELHGRRSGAAASTVAALVFGLREGLVAATELNAEQLRAVCERLQNFLPHIATAWRPNEVKALIAIWSKRNVVP